MRLEHVNVGIDVDGVLADSLPVACEAVRNQTGVDIRPSDITEWNPEIPELNTTFGQVLSNIIDEDPTLYHDMPPVPGAVRGMEQLQDAGATVTIVTHRDAEYHDVTQEWLRDNAIPYDSFATEIDHRTPKHKAGVDILVDDSPRNLRDVASAGQYGIMMLRQTGQNDIPTDPRIYRPREETHTRQTLIENPGMQWSVIPSLIEDICGE